MPRTGWPRGPGAAPFLPKSRTSASVSTRRAYLAGVRTATKPDADRARSGRELAPARAPIVEAGPCRVSALDGLVGRSVERRSGPFGGVARQVPDVVAALAARERARDAGL